MEHTEAVKISIFFFNVVVQGCRAEGDGSAVTQVLFIPLGLIAADRRHTFGKAGKVDFRHGENPGRSSSEDGRVEFAAGDILLDEHLVVARQKRETCARRELSSPTTLLSSMSRLPSSAAGLTMRGKAEFAQVKIGACGDDKVGRRDTVLPQESLGRPLSRQRPRARGGEPV